MSRLTRRVYDFVGARDEFARYAPLACLRGFPRPRVSAIIAAQLLPTSRSHLYSNLGRIVMVPNCNSRTLKFEQVENRLCPAVLVDLGSNGDLAVSGDTAGIVAITAIDSDSYQVTEGGALVATVDGVSRGIRVDLGASSDSVTIDLAGQTVNGTVQINLGGGDNSLTLMHGTINGHLVIQGGVGIDTIAAQNDISVRKNTQIDLGDGDNVATVSGRHFGQLTVQTNTGNDVVTIDADADVAKHAKIRLGGGDNTFSTEGNFARHLFYDGFEGNDTVTILAHALVAWQAKINLGDGINTFTLEGRINRDLMLYAGNGVDTINVLSNARIMRDVHLKLGDGDNICTFEGDVKRSLQIQTGAGIDAVDIASSARVSRDAKVDLGGGNDGLIFAGRIGRNFNVNGGDGTDTFTDAGGTAKTLQLNSIEVMV